MINHCEFSILVVEDSATQAELLRWTLAGAGYDVCVANDGVKALEIIRIHRPSLVISDVTMPIMDGYRLCQEIKSDPKYWDIPVILLTALSDPKDVIKGLSSRADNYVTKPFNSVLLLSRVESLLANPPKLGESLRREPLELNYEGETYFLVSEPKQILNLLISTYENAVLQSRELVETQRKLVSTNEELDAKLSALLESEKRFEVLVQMIPDIVYRIDTKGIFTFVNKAVSQIGYKPEDLIGKHFSEIMVPSDVESVSRDHVLPKYRGKFTGPENAPKLFDERRTGDRITRNLEVRLVRKDPKDDTHAVVESIGTEVISVEINSSGLYGLAPDGTQGESIGTIGVSAKKKRIKVQIGTVGAIRDVTDRKMTEAALLRSEERFRLLVQTAGSAIVLLSPNNLVLEWNHEAEIVFGRHRESILGKDFLDLFTADEQKTVMRDALQTTLTGKEVIGLEALITNPDTGSFRILWNMSLLFDKDLCPIAIIAVGQDVTQWKNAEEERLNAKAEAEMALRSAKVATDTIDGMLDAVVLVRSDGVILQFNKGFSDSTGWGEELIGRSLTEYVEADSVMTISQALASCFSEGLNVRNIECKISTRDNGKIPILLNATLINDSEGKPSRIIAVLRDITELKIAAKEKEDLQIQLFQSQKMEALGTLVGGIAHDFNNMLQVIIGHADILLDGTKTGEPALNRLRSIIETGQSGAALVKKLLAFGQQGQVFPVPLDLNRQITELLTLMLRTLPQMVQVDLELIDGPTTIRADHNQIDQIIMNLAINASEAMAYGGRLVIATTAVSLDEEYCKSHIGVKPGSYVMLSVTDTGRGMDKATLERIFDPFFSTKQRGSTKGTGLGLSVVKGIVQQLGGHIVCESEPGKGTVLKIYFPAIETPVMASKAVMPTVQSSGETILVVEDNIPVAELEMETLENAGYKVVVATNGKEALEIYQARKEEISLVILDLLMPEMSGRDCLKELVKIDSSVKVLIASGYAPEDELHKEISPLVKGFVHKPFAIPELLNEARRVMENN